MRVGRDMPVTSSAGGEPARQMLAQKCHANAREDDSISRRRERSLDAEGCDNSGGLTFFHSAATSLHVAGAQNRHFKRSPAGWAGGPANGTWSAAVKS